MKLFLQAVLAVFYLTRILLFEEKDSHFGPFESTRQHIHRYSNHYSQPVTLFDRIRRAVPLLNPYVVEHDGELWSVDEKKMERWTCPVCLSVWIILAVTLFISIFIERPRSLSDLAQKILFAGSLAGSTTILYSLYGWLNGGEMQLWVEAADGSDVPYSDLE